MKKLKRLFSAIAQSPEQGVTTETLSSCCGGGGHNHHYEASSKSKTNYQCPMGCEGDKTYETPGNCPVCNMSLVTVMK